MKRLPLLAEPWAFAEPSARAGRTVDIEALGIDGAALDVMQAAQIALRVGVERHSPFAVYAVLARPAAGVVILLREQLNAAGARDVCLLEADQDPPPLVTTDGGHWLALGGAAQARCRLRLQLQIGFRPPRSALAGHACVQLGRPRTQAIAEITSRYLELCSGTDPAY